MCALPYMRSLHIELISVEMVSFYHYYEMRKKKKREKSPQFYIGMIISMWIIYKLRLNRVENEEIDRAIKMHDRAATAVKFRNRRRSFDVSIDYFCKKKSTFIICISGMPVCLSFWIPMNGWNGALFKTCFWLCVIWLIKTRMNHAF